MSDWIRNIAILFTSSLVCGLALSVANLPPIIGYMIAGVFLGSSSATTGYLKGLEEIPLIMLMFIAGLHLEISGFIKSAKTSVKFVTVQMGLVILFVLSALLMPKAIFVEPVINFLINYGYAASGFVLVFAATLLKGRSIQLFSNKNDLTKTLAMLTTLLVIAIGVGFATKIYFNCSMWAGIFILANKICLPIVLTPFCLRLPNRAFRLIGATIVIALSFYGACAGGLNTQKLTLSLLCSLPLVVVPEYLKYASTVAKYIIPTAFVGQILLAGGAFFMPGLQRFLPAIVGMGAPHIQIMIMIISLLSLHSTAIAFKLMETKTAGSGNSMKDASATLVQPAVTSILIAQDLLFAGIIILLDSFGNNLSLIKLLPKIAIAVGILYAVKVISKPLKTEETPISRLLDYMRDISMELVTLFSLTFCFLGALMGDYIGLSDLYGAFVAGLLLGNIHQKRKLVLSCCEPISDILMVLFFIQIGLSLNFNYVIENFAIISFINLMIILIKYLVNYQSGKIVYKTEDEADEEEGAKFDKNCLMLMSILMTQVTEFFAIIIGIVKKSFAKELCISTSSIGKFFSILESSCIVSLTLGCLVTVFIKRYLLSQKKKSANITKKHVDRPSSP